MTKQFCPNHRRTELKVMSVLWKGSHIEFCPKGCLWGLLGGKWVQLKVEVA